MSEYINFLRDEFLKLLQSITSLYSNTLLDLGIFLGLLGAWFFWRLASRAHRIRQGKANVGLRIGAWGTRGKSGTERIKAALFHGLGYEVLSKTTGCEAMVIHSIPAREAQEIFLYRTYDKATIWEQADVVEMAGVFKPNVLLYECMALNPKYVSIISHDWMKDEFTTLTNGYPDHEDLQGPSGKEVATTIAYFMPQDTTCYTAEEQMLPVFKERARKVNAKLIPPDYRDADFVPEELQKRFPYNEHPYNIELVARMAMRNGIPEGVCYKEMADYILPDIGVLKVFGDVNLNGRVLEFSNGHSANERTGALSNWTRLNFATPTELAPTDLIVPFINNRADRIPRSKVFAAMLVNDVSCDEVFVVGTNTPGFKGFVEAELEQMLETFNPFEDPQGLTPHDSTINLFRRVRLGYHEDVVAARIASMHPRGAELDFAVDGKANAAVPMTPDALDQWPHAAELPEDGRVWLRNHLDWNTRARAIATRMEGSGQSAVKSARELYREIFWAKFFIHDNPAASASQLVKFVADNVPPGMRSRVLGMMNIKGPGLTWVGAWVMVDRVQKQLERVSKCRNESDLPELVDWFRLTPKLGYLGVATAREGLARLQSELELLRSPRASELLADAEEQFTEEWRKCDEEAAGLKMGPAQKWLKRVSRVLEPWLEVGDGRRRKKQANAIYAALGKGLISHEAAQQELYRIVMRGKGGWVYDMLLRRLTQSKGH